MDKPASKSPPVPVQLEGPSYDDEEDDEFWADLSEVEEQLLLLMPDEDEDEDEEEEEEYAEAEGDRAFERAMAAVAISSSSSGAGSAPAQREPPQGSATAAAIREAADLLFPPADSTPESHMKWCLLMDAADAVQRAADTGAQLRPLPCGRSVLKQACPLPPSLETLPCRSHCCSCHHSTAQDPMSIPHHHTSDLRLPEHHSHTCTQHAKPHLATACTHTSPGPAGDSGDLDDWDVSSPLLPCITLSGVGLKLKHLWARQQQFPGMRKPSIKARTWLQTDRCARGLAGPAAGPGVKSQTEAPQEPHTLAAILHQKHHCCYGASARHTGHSRPFRKHRQKQPNPPGHTTPVQPCTTALHPLQVDQPACHHVQRAGGSAGCGGAAQLCAVL